MAKTTEKNEYVEYRVKYLSFYAKSAKYCSYNIKHTAYNELRKTVSVDFPKQRYGHKKHQSAGNHINRHSNRFKLFEKEKLRKNSEQSTAPRKNKNENAVAHTHSVK